jgi:arylsulfatase A-like enzyme
MNRRNAFKLTAAAVITQAMKAVGQSSASMMVQRKTPNVLFFLCDQLNLRLLSCYGGPIRTPNLERLCRSGVRFDNAVCTYPLCSPNRASLVTGLYPHTHGIVYNVNNVDYPEYAGPPTEQGIDLEDHTLGKLFHQAGYDTHHYGKWHLDGSLLPYYPDPYDDQHQYAEEMAGIFRQVRRQPRSQWMKWYGWSLPVTVSDAVVKTTDALEREAHGSSLAEFVDKSGRLDLPMSEVFDVRVADHAVQRLATIGDQPFFITASFNYPHDPNVVPSPYYEMVSPQEIELPGNFNECAARFQNDWSRKMVVALGLTGLREMLRTYYTAVMLLDGQVGRVLDALERTGKAADTIVVFTTDHGDMAGGHGMFWKSTECFYEDVTRVPLIISCPSLFSSGTSQAAVSSADIMPTLLDLAGVAQPTGVEGKTLAPILERKATETERGKFSFCERITPNQAHVRQFEPGMRGSFMVRGDQWKYIRYWDGDEYLYDLSQDPGEAGDLAHVAQYRGRKEEMIRVLDAWKANTHCPAYA